MLSIHPSIRDKLVYFHEHKQIPNLLFHGPSGSGKRTLVHELIQLIYDGDPDRIHRMVMWVNTSHRKGIRFVRDELSFFCKTHIYTDNGSCFKTIVLQNADKLTVDAMSALRRCIEMYSHSTRFFMIVEDKYKLLNPILLRFCEIRVNEPILANQSINLHRYQVSQTFHLDHVEEERLQQLATILDSFRMKRDHKHQRQRKHSSSGDEPSRSTDDNKDEAKDKDQDNNTTTKEEEEEDNDKQDMINLCNQLVDQAFSALDLMTLLDQPTIPSCFPESTTPLRQYEWLIAFHKARKEIRNEQVLLLFMLHFIFCDGDAQLDNMTCGL